MAPPFYFLNKQIIQHAQAHVDGNIPVTSLTLARTCDWGAWLIVLLLRKTKGGLAMASVIQFMKLLSTKTQFHSLKDTAFLESS